MEKKKRKKKRVTQWKTEPFVWMLMLGEEEREGCGITIYTYIAKTGKKQERARKKNYQS